MSDSLRIHGLQHARPPCPSPTPRVYSNSCPWIGDAIQPSPPLLSPSPPASIFASIRVFSNESVLSIRWPKYWSFSFIASGGQSIGVSASASVLPMNIQDWFPLRLTYLIFLAVQGTFRSLLQHHSLKASILKHSTFFTIQLLQPYMTTGKL